jgi:Family of unknown function (DUF6356)
MFAKLFTDHPTTVGETYAEHFEVASTFGFTMIFAGLACLVHAVVPGWCVTTGSDAIRRLHNRMVANRRRNPAIEDPLLASLMI